jgi:predicted O-methyltransferase YrrM
MASTIQKLWDRLRGVPPESAQWTLEEFGRRFEENLRDCTWEPHPLYSVFTQYDQHHYLREKEMFMHKYRCFYAVSRTISPPTIIELGVLAGSGSDAYLSATPDAKFIGIDVFVGTNRQDDRTPWNPMEIAESLFKARGFKKYKLIKKDLRGLTKLPRRSYMVVVDAAHDMENEYADLQLALTADPTFIFVDDAEGEGEAKPAIEKFLQHDIPGRVEYTYRIPYIGGGLVIKLKR